MDLWKTGGTAGRGVNDAIEKGCVMSMLLTDELICGQHRTERRSFRLSVISSEAISLSDSGLLFTARLRQRDSCVDCDRHNSRTERDLYSRNATTNFRLSQNYSVKLTICY